MPPSIQPAALCLGFSSRNILFAQESHYRTGDSNSSCSPASGKKKEKKKKKKKKEKEEKEKKKKKGEVTGSIY